MTMELPKDIANWVNRVLLGVVAFFLYQINNKIIDFESKMDVAIVNQALVIQEQERMKSDIDKVERDLKKTNLDVIELFKIISKD